MTVSTELPSICAGPPTRRGHSPHRPEAPTAEAAIEDHHVPLCSASHDRFAKVSARQAGTCPLRSRSRHDQVQITASGQQAVPCVIGRQGVGRLIGGSGGPSDDWAVPVASCKTSATVPISPGWEAAPQVSGWPTAHTGSSHSQLCTDRSSLSSSSTRSSMRPAPPPAPYSFAGRPTCHLPWTPAFRSPWFPATSSAEMRFRSAESPHDHRFRSLGVNVTNRGKARSALRADLRRRSSSAVRRSASTSDRTRQRLPRLRAGSFGTGP